MVPIVSARSVADIAPESALPYTVTISSTRAAAHSPIVLVSPQIRAAVKRLTENHLPQLVVMSFNEVTRDTKIVTLGMVADKA